ncbi:hypothetical protein B0O99DRAFT_123179 [Bisporella sp. PMI_857]|nr:hypothetical protein B0O99DRAFT_123179 [Bisporella sp. PMI_857]
MRCALTPALPSELIDFVLKAHATFYIRTLIICQPRPAFIESFCRCFTGDEPLREVPESGWETLNQVAASKQVQSIFVPTVSHLRAILAGLTCGSNDGASNQEPHDISKKKPTILVYGLVSLHEDTSQWSTQGFGNTLSSLLDLGLKTHAGVMIVEERRLDHRESEDFRQQSRARRKSIRINQAWQQEVPLLGGSERRDGLGESAGYSGRTVEVSRILARWFRFDEGSWVDNDEE